MLDSISWGEFLKGLGIVLILYYGYVVIRFIRFEPKEIGSWVKGKRNGISGVFGVSVLSKVSGQGTTRRGQEDLSSMERMAELISELDRDVFPVSTTREELIGNLRMRFITAEIPEIPAIRKMLARHILLTTQLRSLSISEEDIMGLLKVS